MYNDKLKHDFSELLAVHEKIRRYFSGLDDIIIARFLGEYDVPELHRQVREHGDGYTIRSLPKSIPDLENIDVFVFVVMNSPKLNENSMFNPFMPLTSIPYWRDGKGLQPILYLQNEIKCRMQFMVWQQECSVHGKDDPNARANRNLLLRSMPKLYELFQDEIWLSEQFLSTCVKWLHERELQLILLTNVNRKNFNNPILNLLNDTRVVHIPTKLFGPNRRIMPQIRRVLNESSYVSRGQQIC